MGEGVEATYILFAYLVCGVGNTVSSIFTSYCPQKGLAKSEKLFKNILKSYFS